MNAARVLREARRRAGLTQRELAAKAGVPQPSIARIESGATIPRVDTLDRLLEQCGEGLYAQRRLGIGVDRTLISRYQSLGGPAVRSRVAEDSEKYIVGGRGKRMPDGAWRPSVALEALTRHDVQFVVIGAYAANLLGSPLNTMDTDVCYERSDENIARLVDALVELNAYLRGAPPGLPFILDAITIKNGLNFTFVTDAGDLDCLGDVAGVEGYAELARSAVEADIGGTRVLVASLEDIIRMKRAAGRPKDLRMIEELGALQEEIDRGPAE
ncbi:MAG TPA: helix-turn-helix transcriptional regulator [Actinomycetota bacterium]